MRVPSIKNKIARQVNESIKLFPGKMNSIPRQWYFERFVSMLIENEQPFYPRREGVPGTETIFRHTIKDLIVVHSFLNNMPEKIEIDGITFPPRNVADPLGTLKRIVEKSRAVFGLEKIAGKPKQVRLLNLFILYHDIAKRTGDRRDHERIGAEYFMKVQSFFRQFLTDNEIKIIYLLIKYHGVYGQIDAARKKGGPLPDYGEFIKEIRASGLSPEEKEFTINSLFLFNVVEGLQSDIYSADFYSTDKFEDILRCFDSVSEKVQEKSVNDRF